MCAYQLDLRLNLLANLDLKHVFSSISDYTFVFAFLLFLLLILLVASLKIVVSIALMDLIFLHACLCRELWLCLFCLEFFDWIRRAIVNRPSPCMVLPESGKVVMLFSGDCVFSCNCHQLKLVFLEMSLSWSFNMLMAYLFYFSPCL